MVKFHQGIVNFNQLQSLDVPLVICNFFAAMQCLHNRSEILQQDKKLWD